MQLMMTYFTYINLELLLLFSSIVCCYRLHQHQVSSHWNPSFCMASHFTGFRWFQRETSLLIYGHIAFSWCHWEMVICGMYGDVHCCLLLCRKFTSVKDRNLYLIILIAKAVTDVLELVIAISPTKPFRFNIKSAGKY